MRCIAGASARSRVARPLQWIAGMLNKTDDLKNRVEAKRNELRARLKELKADTRAEAIATKDKIKQGLHDLDDTLKVGWDKVNDAVHAKLDEWITHHSN
jgi:dGTP triphosphohydrolase